MDFVALFKDFGFPALVTGVLLWMYATKLERVVTALEALKASNEALKSEIARLDIKLDRMCEDVVSVKENTKPRGART